MYVVTLDMRSMNLYKLSHMVNFIFIDHLISLFSLLNDLDARITIYPPYSYYILKTLCGTIALAIPTNKRFEA